MSAIRITAAILSKWQSSGGSCQVTLGPLSPYLTPDISGQTASKTTSTAAGGNEQYIAATDAAAFWASGVRFIAGICNEFSGVTANQAQASIFAATNTGKQVVAGYVGGNSWSFRLMNGGSVVGATSVSGLVSAVPAIGIDPVSRNVVAYLGMTQVTSGPFAPAGAADGFFTGTSQFVGDALGFQSNGIMSMTLVTSSYDFPSSLPGNDWCGNEIE